jgi:transposase
MLKDIAGHVRRKFGKKLTLSGVWRLLQRHKITRLVPRPMPAKADPKKAEFVERLTELVWRLSPHDTLFYEDESSFTFSGTPHKVYGRKGSKPTLKIHGGRQRQAVVGAIDAIRERGFFKYIHTLNAATFEEFLRDILSQYPGPGKVYMILDNRRSHHAKLLKPLLERFQEKLALVFLPPYSPDLNSIQGIWQEVKRRVVYDAFYPTFDTFLASLSSMLRQVSSTPTSIRSQCQRVKYCQKEDETPLIPSRKHPEVILSA